MKTKEVLSDGTTIYRDKNKKYHREDGPAVIYPNDNKEWYRHGKLHREDGPAVIRDGSEYWYRNGHLHREDGPAINHDKDDPTSNTNNCNGWFLNGKKIHYAFTDIKDLYDKHPEYLI